MIVGKSFSEQTSQTQNVLHDDDEDGMNPNLDDRYTIFS